MAHIRMWAGDYTLSGLVGFELRCKTVGILGTGAIGAAAARIFCVSPSATDLPVLCLCSAAPELWLPAHAQGHTDTYRALPVWPDGLGPPARDSRHTEQALR